MSTAPAFRAYNYFYGASLLFARKSIVRVEYIVQRVRITSGLTALGLLMAAAAFVHAQPGIQLPPLPSDMGPQPYRLGPPKKILDRYPENPSLPPTFTISVGPLGFSVPGKNYLLRRESLVSLDFLDENRILFTFRAPGLILREAADRSNDQKQQIQALVLSLPGGKIDSRAAWTVPGRSRYLWMLNDGHFLLHVPDGLDEGDAQLQMNPYLRMPGRLLWIEMDPEQQVMITNSLEPAMQSRNVGESGPLVTGPPAATTEGQKPDAQSVLVARTQNLASGKEMLVSRVPWTNQTNDWPMNSEGYLETSQDNPNQWFLTLHSFSGGDRVLTRAVSLCPPEYNFVSDSELLLAACDPETGWKLGAMLTSGLSLWETQTATNVMRPLLVTAPNSSRVARETLLLKRSVDRYKRMIGVADLQGQIVKVFNAADGKMVLESPLAPILDGGGNVAISPSGQRVAILNAGAIQVFQLPAPPPVPGSH